MLRSIPHHPHCILSAYSHVLLSVVTLLALLTTALEQRTCLGEEKRPNVLLIAVDDLNDWVGCLQGHPDARSPHIDRLAQRGVLFSNAHCQAPICNPSRTSIMYGLRPSTTGVYGNAPKPWTVAGLKKRTTLARHFAANGYQTFTTGKIYHGSGLPTGDFDVVGPRPGQRQKIDERLVAELSGLWDFGAQKYDEKLFQDHVDASWAIERLSEQHERPFFLAIGFYRPHVPFYSPQRVFDQIPLADVDLPPSREDDRADIPKIAWNLTKAPAAPPHQWFVDKGEWKNAVRSYLSCVRWTDEQVGRLLDALDKSPHADNTIIVFYSDHGFFLGEKQRWAKQSLWERATKVPFIISAPGLSRGATCRRPAELLSIYATLIDLCKLSQQPGIEGRSLRPLLQDPQAAWPHPAITTHGQGNHSVRTERHRLIRYHDGSLELYDMQADPNEWTNLANREEHAELVAKLIEAMPQNNASPARAVARRKPAPKQTGPKKSVQ